MLRYDPENRIAELYVAKNGELMKKLTIITIILISVFCSTFGHCLEDVSFFEATYGVKLKDVGKITDYDDPDQFYVKIATQLGIPTVSKNAVEKKDGWEPSNSVILNAIVKRSERYWVVMVFRFTKITGDKKPDFDTYEQRFVVINDKKEVVYYGEEQPKRVEQSAAPGAQ